MFGMNEAAQAIVPTVETPHPWMDFVRLGAVFIPGVIVLAMSLVVIAKYVRVYLMDRKLSKAQGRPSSWRGLLPVHVAAIAVSYCGLVVMLLTNIVVRFREPLYSTPRTVVYSFFLWLGVAALYVMTNHSKRRAVQIQSVTFPETMRDGCGPESLGCEKGAPPPS